MNLLFLSSLEKTTEEGHITNAQVSISEQQGVWYAIWSELNEEGEPTQETWYEGLHWQELLAVFREQVFAKQCEGFKPLVDMGVRELAIVDVRNLPPEDALLQRAACR
ncbi:hypothetical protein [Paenibacillus cremeus]|uniref:hypothetical protein n=1 Tax=Paenibacillus cremeus TaxID=2163881 RepID=UPI0021BD7165|nr:hypothetical protein [Paenibacillus cremeus]